MARRHHLIAVAVIAALGSSIAPRPAHALFGVGDVVFDPSVFAQVVQQAKNGLQQLQQLEQNGQILTNQLMQLRTFYESFAHLTDVSQLASILQTPAVTNPLPQITQLEGMLSGNGFTGQLGSLVQQFVNQNRAYAPTGTDWQAQEMQRTANITASQMALGNQLYSSAAQRIQGLSELQARLATSSDPKETLDLIARTNVENGLAQAQALQGQSLMIMQQAQQQAEQQREAEAFRQGADQLVTAAQSAASRAASGQVSLIDGQ
jgi:type IV secretion system protein VirB5